MKRRFMGCMALAGALALMVTGCGQQAAETEDTTTASTSTEYGDLANMDFPLDVGNAEISYYTELNSLPAAKYDSLEDTPFDDELEKATGVTINWIHTNMGQTEEQLNLMLASGDLPDIIEPYWWNFTGGPQKAINDGYIIPLNDLIDKYSPALKEQLSLEPFTAKMVQTDNGDYYCYPCTKMVNLDGTPGGAATYCGLVLRQDWLEDLGMEVPETIDEWETVLKAFKDQKGATAPLSYAASNSDAIMAFCGAFGVSQEFFIDDNGEMQYGAITPEYKEYLELMKRWYSEGLIDANIANVTGTMLDTAITTGKTGASYTLLGSGMRNWLQAKKDDPTYKLVAAKYPVLNKGDKPEFGQKSFNYDGGVGAAITTACQHPELVARFLDYGYTPEGHMLYQFGVEGITYEMVDGEPVFTDYVQNNPDGLSFGTALAGYSRGSYNGPYNSDFRFSEQYYNDPALLNAMEVWGETNELAHLVPFIQPSEDEQAEYTNIMADVKTYVDEMRYKFMFGTESLDNYDAYVQQIKSLGLDRALEIYRGALERFNNR